MVLNEIILGHLTQLLWASSEAVGCASANIWIPNKPGYVGEGMTSSYTVCHYSPQGNIIGHEKENYKPRRDGEFSIFTKRVFFPLQFRSRGHQTSNIFAFFGCNEYRLLAISQPFFRFIFIFFNCQHHKNHNFDNF